MTTATAAEKAPAKTPAKRAAKAAKTDKRAMPQTQLEQDADSAGPRSSALKQAIQQQGGKYVLDGNKLSHEPRRTNSITKEGRVWSEARDKAEAAERGPNQQSGKNKK